VPAPLVFPLLVPAPLVFTLLAPAPLVSAPPIVIGSSGSRSI
jgi:hypothetical protein